MTTTRLLTADDLLALPDDGMRRELVRGELRTMTPAGFDHGAVVMNLASLVGPFVKHHGLGVASGAETGFRLAADPDTLRASDLGFVARERIPRSGRPVGFFPGAPDLAVHAPSGEARILGEEDTLGGGEVLPGFACSVAELFA